MRVAHFSNAYLPHVKGVARSVSTFRDGLSRLGHQVFVFAPEAPAGYKETAPFIFRYPGVQVPQFNYAVPVPYSRFVSKLLLPLKLHMIHSNHPVALGVTAARYAEKLGLPLVFTFHTRYIKYADEYTDALPFTKSFVKNIVIDDLVKYLGRCQYIVTPSDSIKDGLANIAGLTERVTATPTGIDLQPYQQADVAVVRHQHGLDNKKVMISVGRLATEKNVKTLLKAAAQVLNQRPETQLVMVGDGPQGSELRTYAHQLGVAEQITFIGRIPFEQVPQYLKAADLFCFASVTETQGLVSMEAMAAGLPVVAVEASGTRDTVVHNQEGLLTANDAEALALAMRQTLDDPVLLTRLKTGAQQKAQTFDLVAQARKMVNVYEQAVEDKKAGRKIKVDKALLWARIKSDFASANI